MSFDVEGARKAGYSDSEIADHLAQQGSFDAAGARQAGYSDADIIGHLSASSAVPETIARPEKDYKALSVPQHEPDTAATRFARGGAQVATALGRAVAPAVGAAGRAIGSDYLASAPEATNQMGDLLAYQEERGAPQGIDWANLAGQTVATLPMAEVKGLQMLGKAAPIAERLVGGAATGAATAAPGNEGTGAAAGAAANAFLPPVLRGLGRVVKPAASTAGAKLAAQGIDLTVGQRLGGGWKATEDALTGLPLLGSLVKNAQQKSVESFNRVVIDRSLAPIGEKLPDGVVGHEAIAFAKSKLGDAYDALLPKLKLDAEPNTAGGRAFLASVNNLKSMAAQLPPEQAAKFRHIFQNEVIGKFTGSGKMSGETFKKVEGRLTQLSSDFRRSTTPFDRDVGDAIAELNRSMRQLAEDSSPAYEGQLKKINEGYANFKRVQRAAGYAGSQDGVFSPEAYHGAVKALDRSKDKAAFSEGRALGQDLSGTAKQAFGKLPNSGTPERLLTAGTIANALTKGTAELGALAMVPKLGALAIPYLPGGRQLTNALLFKRPPIGKLANAAAAKAGLTPQQINYLNRVVRTTGRGLRTAAGSAAAPAANALLNQSP